MSTIPRKGSYRPGLLFPDNEYRNAGARCDKHCQHFRVSSCWVATYPMARYQTAEMCCDYKPISERDENDP